MDIFPLVSVGNHLFTPEALAAQLEKSIPTIPDGHHSAVVAGIDASGAEVSVIWHKNGPNGTWDAKGAYLHSWTGDDRIAGQVMYSWGD